MVSKINRVGVAISTWNRADDLDRCLSLLFKQDCNFDLYVIDNCSNDNTVDILDKYEVDYKVMPHSNFSAIYTINMALRGLVNEYLVILDDDTFLEDSSSIRRMVETADIDSNIAIVACNIRNKLGNISLVLKTALFDAIDYEQVSSDVVFDIDDFCGACALFRSSMVSPDFYDESFKLYWNEPELAVRMVASGYRVVINQSIRVIHGSDVGRQSCKYFYYGSRNTFRFMSKVFPRDYCLYFTCVLMIIHVRRFIKMYKEKKFLTYLIKLIFVYMQSYYRCFFAKRIEFIDDSTRRRVLNTYIKYYLKEIFLNVNVT